MFPPLKDWTYLYSNFSFYYANHSNNNNNNNNNNNTYLRLKGRMPNVQGKGLTS